MTAESFSVNTVTYNTSVHCIHGCGKKAKPRRAYLTQKLNHRKESSQVPQSITCGPHGTAPEVAEPSKVYQ